jgi:hypothetical protein
MCSSGFAATLVPLFVCVGALCGISTVIQRVFSVMSCEVLSVIAQV